MLPQSFLNIVQVNKNQIQILFVSIIICIYYYYYNNNIGCSSVCSLTARKCDRQHDCNPCS